MADTNNKNFPFLNLIGLPRLVFGENIVSRLTSTEVEYPTDRRFWRRSSISDPTYWAEIVKSQWNFRKLDSSEWS